MEINDRYDGTNNPFQGDRVLRVATIPAGARIRRATAMITPKSAPTPAELFTELVEFLSSSTVSTKWGATKSRAGDLWVEVDLHARRTLASVSGTNFLQGTQKSTLQVDFGGAYVEINRAGGIKTPSDSDPFELSSNTNQPLPGLTVNKFKITNPISAPVAGSGPDVTSVTIRSVPTNISLRFGETPSFWTRVGEMTQAETSPDFTLALQAFLADAEPENGFYNVPLIVHSDSIARLQIDLDVQFDVEENALSGLNSIALPFEFGRAPNVETQALQLNLPMNARLSPRASRARLQGNFAETRIVYDPMEKVARQTGSPVGFVQSVAPVDRIRISPNSAQAQPVSFDRELSATAIDLLLEVKQTARLQLNLREDLDGKPGPASLLPNAVEFEVPGPVGLENTAESAVVSKWTSVVLPADFKFKASDAQTPTRYWIVMQSVEGEAQLSVAAAKDAPNLIERIGIQRSTEDGLSWRETAAPRVTGPLAAFFRLRRKPDRFEMPIALQVGGGNEAVRVSLERFAPTGAVNLELDFDDFNQGLNEHLKKRGPVCSEADHLLNGDFEDWIRVVPLPVTSSTAVARVAAATPKRADTSTDQPAEWTLTAGSVKRFPLLNQSQVESEDHFAVLGVRIDPLGGFSLVQSALSQVTPVIESCTYDFSFEAIASSEDAIAEVFWLGETCTAVLPEPVRVPIKTVDKNRNSSFTINLATTSSSGLFSRGSLPFPLHRVRVTAPAGAKQAEVRFSVPDGVVAAVDNVFLKGTTEAIANGDFRLSDGNKLASWQVSTTTGLNVQDMSPARALKFDNSGSNPFDITQVVTVKPDQPFIFTVKKGATVPGLPGTLPRVETRWFKANGSETEPPVVLELDPASFSGLSASGTSPIDAVQAEIHLFVPPRTSQEIESISLAFPTHTVIPVTFVAEAPGELIVVDWQIGFEAAPAMRPPIPPGGLCTATPPDSQPGETSDDRCFCKCCDSHQPIANAFAMQTDNGTPAMLGLCASCGDEMISFSGKLVPGAPKVSVAGTLDAQPIFISTTPVKADTAPVEPAPPQVEPAPAPVELAPPQVEPAPAPVEPAPSQVEPAPAPVEPAPAPVEPAPAPVELAPPQVEPAPAPVEPAPAPVEPAPAPVEPALAPVEPAPAPVEPAPAPVEPAPAPAELQPITSVRGIGPKLAEQLVRRGITSLETLAAALPKQVADVKGISEAKAAEFIAQARKLIR